MKAIIIEDQPQILEQNKALILKNFPLIEFVGESGSVRSGVDLINEHQPDILFLDVELSDGYSFEILEQIDYSRYKIVFVTSFDKYAVKAFRFAAVDYLLKPLDEAELRECLLRVIASKTSDQNALQVLLNNHSENSLRKISLQNSDGTYITQVDKIVHIEAYGNYTKFYIENREKPLLISKTMKEFEKLLKDDGFLRVHHGHMVNQAHIHKFVSKDGGHLIMTGNKEVPVSQRKRHEIVSYIDSL
ncbi:MAG: LytTR family DNA-binding domain-containing protein [Flavobacteriales bacterium]|nr:LytTR family DNA-binding domain-containing protein [Flavobacteriales bacterium]